MKEVGKRLKDVYKRQVVMCHPDYSKGWPIYQTYRLLNFKVSIFTSLQEPDFGPEGRGPR